MLLSLLLEKRVEIGNAIRHVVIRKTTYSVAEHTTRIINQITEFNEMRVRLIKQFVVQYFFSQTQRSEPLTKEF